MKNIYLGILFTFTAFFTQAQTWQQGPALPENVLGRNHAVSFTLNGFGYLGTGYNNDDSTQTFNDFYKFDPSKNEWTKLPDFPGLGRGFSYAVTYGNKAYLGFGLNMRRDTVNNRTLSFALSDLWEFDGATETWKQLATCPCTPRYHPALVAAAGKVFVTAGGSGQGNLKDHWEYDIASDRWTNKTDLPGVRRHHPYHFGIDSTVYVGFGHGQGIFKDFYAWSVVDEKWTRVADLPAQGRVAGTQFAFEGKGYALSGQGETHENLDSGEFWQYDPETNKWEELPAHPGTGRWAPATFIIDGTLYFGTGQTDFEHKDFWTFTLPSDIITSVHNPANNASLIIYPNPTTGMIHFSQDVESIEVFDPMGKKVHSISQNERMVDLSGLQNGMYLLRIYTTQGVFTKRVLKTN